VKCPQCKGDQKYKEGMVCGSCGWEFTLDPKVKPYMSDMAFHMAQERLSGPAGNWFTYNQLYAGVHRMLEKKKQWGMGSVVLITGVVFFISLIPADILGIGLWLPILCAALTTAACIFYSKRPLKIRRSTISRIIGSYHAKHPPDRMADGKQFETAEPNGFDEKFLDFAPERILIVERNTLADMLLLNRFHFENKTLVLSAQKYPSAAFSACQNTLSQFPNTPVCLIHDASKKGIGLKEKLLADPTWHLGEKQIQDLGLFPEDVARLKRPVWMPPAEKTDGPHDSPSVHKTAAEKIGRGWVMPVDVAPPKAMMSSAALAMTAGLVLLSEELLAEQARQAHAGTATFGGGFG